MICWSSGFKKNALNKYPDLMQNGCDDNKMTNTVRKNICVDSELRG